MFGGIIHQLWDRTLCALEIFNDDNARSDILKIASVGSSTKGFLMVALRTLLRIRHQLPKQACTLYIRITIIQVDLFTLFALHGPDKVMSLSWLLETNQIRLEELRTRRSSIEGKMVKGDFQANSTAAHAAASDIVGNLTSALNSNLGDLIKRNLFDKWAKRRDERRW